MNRRSFFTRLPFLGAVTAAAAAITHPAPAKKVSYVLTLRSPQCPKCLICFDCSIKTDEQAKYLNWDPDTQTIVVEHPKLHEEYAQYDCIYAGMKLRFQLPRVSAEVLPSEP